MQIVFWFYAVERVNQGRIFQSSCKWTTSVAYYRLGYMYCKEGVILIWVCISLPGCLLKPNMHREYNYDNLCCALSGTQFSLANLLLLLSEITAQTILIDCLYSMNSMLQLQNRKVILTIVWLLELHCCRLI